MDDKGRIQKGERLSPATEFKKGQHWRKKKPFWDYEWLYREYVEKQRSAGEIAIDFNVTHNAIHFWLQKHGIPGRDMAQIRQIKKWGLSGETNGMHGRTGARNPHWKGGITPERQALYASTEWGKLVRFIRHRDNYTCQRCHIKKRGMHLHHLVSFAVKELRLEPANLILVCKKCHNWIHSKKNINREFIKDA